MRERTAALAVFVPLVALAASCSGWNLKTAREERTSSATIGSGRALHVDTVNGGVSIVADPSLTEVAIVAEVTAAAPTAEEARARLAGIDVIAENVNGGDLAISVAFPDGKARSSEGCSFEIRTPAAEGVSVTTGNGAIRIEGLAGRADLRTSNGAVTVAGHDGPIGADSSNGGIDIRGANAEVRAETSNGPIELRAAHGFAAAFDLDTSNGDVEVYLPIGGSADIDANTSNGSLTVRGQEAAKESTGSRRSRSLRIGAGGPKCRIDTSNGSILISIEDTRPEAEPRR